MQWRKVQNIAFALFIALVAVSLISFQFFGDDFGVSNIRDRLADFGIWAPLAFIAIYVVATIFFPSTPFMAAAGLLFGFKSGLLYTLIGGTLSSILVFTISRELGQEKIDSMLRRKHMRLLKHYNSRLEAGGIWNLVILRITPIMPFNVLNILMGVSKIKLGSYIIGTIIGLIPSNLLTVYFGNYVSALLGL